ncbi:MAG: NADH-quinone oxidoreductase subunit M, partial [Chloroflexi bacterium]|nr:NADH-quinone oxidoreductase subunit M [Chloroflexota bacterium]
MTEFPFLSVITLSPIATAIIILMMPKERGENSRMLALAAMIIGLILSAWVYFGYNIPAAGTAWADTLLFVEEHPWIPSIGINYFLGVDGLSATLVFLTSIVGVGGVLIS